MNNSDEQDKAPDWQIWQHMPEVKLWQAVVLSLNENPDRLTYSNGRIVSGETVDEYFSDNREATKRLRLLTANLSDRRHFSACTLNMGDPRLSGVRLPEFAEWALSVVEWEGLPPELVAMAQHQSGNAQTIASDEITCDTAERVRNGELIQWDEYWLNRQEITPQQAAKLAHCIDPIKWPSDQCKQGQISDALRIKIQRCAERLAERNNTWTLAALVEAIGKDAAPYGMKQAVYIASEHKARAHQVEDKRNAGRYTLEEAALVLSAATSERANEMIEKFKRAAFSGALPTYEPGKKSLYLYGDKFASRVREFYEECYWFDLNDWLTKNETQITWRFPTPALQKVGAGDTATETPQERRTRLISSCKNKQAAGVKAWKRETAREEGISVQMLDKIIRRETPATTGKAGTIEGLKGLKIN